MGGESQSGFVVGQRWMSEAEPELGLGVVLEVDGRQVVVQFPAADEQRRYAIAQAPLKRVLFRAGESVTDGEDRTFTIVSVEERDGLLIYHGSVGAVPESGLQDRLTQDRPYERLFTGSADDPGIFSLRRETLERRFALEQSPVRGFIGGKVELIPHQFYIAREVSRRVRPRVLLADEVGLGKTIEACLVVHHLLTVGVVRRVLVLVPHALLHQWFVELLRRFHLRFNLFDEERCAAVEAGDPEANPFEEEQWVIASVDWLADSPHRAVQAVAAGWDLVIVDEAHHLAWDDEDPGPDYRLVDALSRRVPGLMLLTATPEQTGLESHFARLRLLDPDRFADFEVFVEEHERWAETARKAEKALAQGDEAAVRDLLDRHGPGRVLFRNSRAAVRGFPRRHLHPVKLDEKTPELADWLTGWLEEDRTRKVLVIGGTKRDVDRLYEAMRERTGVAMARFHEAMPLVECDRQAAWFSEPEGARLLIASEAGGEGRNFQFAQHLVLFDLPDHPEMIEQRIGRLDRIGQKGDIHVYVPYQPGSRDEARLRWMHEGLDAFETPLAGGHMLYQRFRDRLDRVDTRLIQETRKAREQLRRDMEKGRDKLLELNSNRPGEAEPLLQAIREADQDPKLESYLLRLLDLCGVHADGLSEHEYLLTRGHLFADLLALPEDGLRFTLNRARALARDDMDFMSWDHPLLLGAMAAVAGSELGRCSAGMSREVESPRLECGFLLEAVAPPELGLGRFLPPAPVFVCLDRTGKPVAPVRGRLAPVPAHLLVDDRILNRESLAAWVQSAEGAAEAIAETLREQALGAMRSVLGGELQRLHALQKINDMIRPEELAALAERITQLQSLIQKSQLRLDSILVVFPER